MESWHLTINKLIHLISVDFISIFEGKKEGHMKTFTLIAFALAACFYCSGQSVLTYEFSGSLNETGGDGPELTVLGNEGTFVLDTLNEIQNNTKTVYRFEYNSGFQFDNGAAGNFLGGTYTIELYFVFDDLTSWKRVADWKNRTTDNGAYVYYGQLNFYPVIYSDDAPVLPGEYTYYVITRDGTTKEVLIYTDGESEIGFTDDADMAVVDESNVVNFFYDDLDVPGEASSGAVAMLKLYDYKLDSATIKQNYENLGSQVFGVKENRKSDAVFVVYPNPASDVLFIDLKNFDVGQPVRLIVLNGSGKEVISAFIADNQADSYRLDVSGLPGGIYLIRAESGLKTSAQKIIILK